MIARALDKTQLNIDHRFQEIIKFGSVSFESTIVNYLVYMLMLMMFRRMGVLESTDYIVAQLVAFVVSVYRTFHVSYHSVFPVDANSGKSYKLHCLMKVYASYALTGVVLNNVLLYMFVEHGHVSEFIAPLVCLCLCWPVNFILNKKWAFRAK